MKKLAIAAPFIWAAIVFFLHIMKVDIDPDSGFHLPHADKAVHFSMFATLSFLWCRSRQFYLKKENSFTSLLWIFFACIGYGAMLEWLQSVTPAKRDSDALDWIADITGTTVGIFVAGKAFLTFFFHHKIWKSA